MAKISINLDEDINVGDTITNGYLILYNPLYSSEVETIVGKKISDDESPHLIRKDETFWLINKC